MNNSKISIEKVDNRLELSKSFDVLEKIGNCLNELSNISKENNITIEIDSMFIKKDCSILTLTLKDINVK